MQIQPSLRWMSAGIVSATLLALAQRRWGMAAAIPPALVGAASAIYAIGVEPRCPVLERVTLHLPRLPRGLEGLRIGHLSDFHLGYLYTRANLQWAVEQMQREQPELIVITGDFVSASRAIADLPDLLQPLHAPLGIYGVTGNHDMWEGAGELCSALEPLGIEFLLNCNKMLHWHETPFWIAGIDDIWYGSPDLDATLEQVPADGFTLFLCHAPDFADQVVDRSIDVQLSGHTHGGQMRLPLLKSSCLPYYGLRYASGLYNVGAMQVYVSRGLGGLPWRLNCPPEATILTLRRD